MTIFGIDTDRKINYQQESLVNETITRYLSANWIVKIVFEINALWGKMHGLLLLEPLCSNPTEPATRVATMAVPGYICCCFQVWWMNSKQMGVTKVWSFWLWRVLAHRLWGDLKPSLWSCSLRTRLAQHSPLHREGPSFTVVLKTKDWTTKDCITHSSLHRLLCCVYMILL